MTPRLRFDRGTVVLEGATAEEATDGFRFDSRVGFLRAPAVEYRRLVASWHRAGQPLADLARDYVPLDRTHRGARPPRDYQREAVAAWRSAGRFGTVVLPTGSGKSFVAELCIQSANRSTLVVAPTIDLVGQWYAQLRRAFGEPVGLLGGGHHEVHPITVSTYDSAYLHMERYGNRFGLIVYDEVHHLPGPSFIVSAEAAIAPFRLGLPATLERPAGRHELLSTVVGPVVYRREIQELAGDFLAPYRTEVLQVHLSDTDRAAYDEARDTYQDFITSTSNYHTTAPQATTNTSPTSNSVPRMQRVRP